jgi:coenzyme PQQ synthesis protein D (PqqD)
MSIEAQSKEGILKAYARTPDHVVFRTFVAETVVLNLNTGKYHGVNPTGGRMLEVLNTVGSVEQAASVLAEEYGQPIEAIQDDLCKFCSDLEQRDLIVLANEPNG